MAASMRSEFPSKAQEGSVAPTPQMPHNCSTRTDLAFSSSQGLSVGTIGPIGSLVAAFRAAPSSSDQLSIPRCAAPSDGTEQPSTNPDTSTSPATPPRAMTEPRIQSSLPTLILWPGSSRSSTCHLQTLRHRRSASRPCRPSTLDATGRCGELTGAVAQGARHQCTIRQGSLSARPPKKAILTACD